VQLRDLRLLDPQLSTSYPSAILARDDALVLNLEFIKVMKYAWQGVEASAGLRSCLLLLELMAFTITCLQHGAWSMHVLRHWEGVLTAISHGLLAKMTSVDRRLPATQALITREYVLVLNAEEEAVIGFIEELQRRLAPKEPNARMATLAASISLPDLHHVRGCFCSWLHMCPPWPFSCIRACTLGAHAEFWSLWLGKQTAPGTAAAAGCTLSGAILPAGHYWLQVPTSSDNLDGTGRVDSEELGFAASEAPFELRTLEIALDVVRILFPTLKVQDVVQATQCMCNSICAPHVTALLSTPWWPPVRCCGASQFWLAYAGSLVQCVEIW
jgi:hypothetical protein